MPDNRMVAAEGGGQEKFQKKGRKLARRRLAVFFMAFGRPSVILEP
jgi:hypothetical protein